MDKSNQLSNITTTQDMITTKY